MEQPINSQEEFNKLSPETQLKFITVAKTEIAEGLKDKENGADKLEKLHQRQWLPQDIKEELGNASKVRNRNLITDKVAEFTLTEGRLPSALEIAAATGLTHTTVYKHLKALRENEYNHEEIQVFNSLRRNFLQGIARAALKDPKSAKMALDIINEYDKRTAGPVGQNGNTNVINILQMINGLPPVQQEFVKKNLLSVTENTVTDVGPTIEEKPDQTITKSHE